ncbi:LPXTG cell wall anchor domain-containing protein [Streptomyces sp. NPDC021093]|uniref:LPXTG cell wall anchor domain-containing protein n=1 Tax=Streptomyces sp. NPDC021093 TaxID=3365112 RepID=UPI0037A7CBD7
MKIRRILATAVAAAVTTPVVFLAAAPAFAAEAPTAGQAQGQKAKPTPAELEKLEKAAADAKKAYDDAVADRDVIVAAALAELNNPDMPYLVKAAEAKKAAKDAADAKTAADKKVTEAQAALDALPTDATDADKAPLQQALKTAQEEAVKAADAKTAADKAYTEADTAADDARVAASRRIHVARTTADKALAVKTAADKALADAKAEAGKPDPTKPPTPSPDPTDPTKPPTPDPTKPPVDEECKVDASLSSTLVGLPSKVVAGTTVNFTLRVTNTTRKDFDEVKPFAVVYGGSKSDYNDIGNLLHLQSAGAGSSDWKDVGEAQYAGTVTNLKAGKSADLKLRLTVDKKAPAADGIAFVAGDYWNENGSCGGNELKEYSFSILAAGSKPGKVDDATSTPVKGNTQVPTPQGGTSTVPVSTDAGNLASTGADGTSQLALAAGAAIVLGAGAVFVVRRRKADQQG